jgi:hypothetical protein
MDRGGRRLLRGLACDGRTATEFAGKLFELFGETAAAFGHDAGEAASFLQELARRELRRWASS